MPPNTPPLKETEMLENVSVEGLKVNDPEAVPETPWSCTLEKLSFELATAGRHTNVKNAAKRPTNL
jgi:hypothetical protein